MFTNTQGTLKEPQAQQVLNTQVDMCRNMLYYTTLTSKAVRQNSCQKQHCPKVHLVGPGALLRSKDSIQLTEY